MELATCTVRLGGDLHNAIVKQMVTPAEVAVLRAMHGHGAVVNIKITGSGTVRHAGERRRLRALYKERLVNTLFPGAIARLPETFAELEEIEMPDAEEVGQEEGIGRTPHVLEEMRAGLREVSLADGEAVDDSGDGDPIGDQFEGDPEGGDDEVSKSELADMFSGAGAEEN